MSSEIFIFLKTEKFLSLKFDFSGTNAAPDVK